MSLLCGVALVPVIEVFDFLDGDGPPSEWDGHQRDEYWRKQVRRAGFPEPVGADPWFVRAADLGGDSGLGTIVNALLTRDDESSTSRLVDRLRDRATREDALDQVPTIPGGYLLCDTQGCVTTPGCCGDLGDLNNWRQAAGHRTQTPEMLWIGHPWLLVAAHDDVLTLVQTVEYGPARESEIGQIHRQDLQAAVVAAATDLAAFDDALRGVCVPIVGPEIGAAVAARMLGDVAR